jgi:DNA-binding response OmpR family regulator
MKKILIVEDDNHISELLSQLLRQNGFTPVAAYSGTEALLALPQNEFSLILLDLMLPGKTGEDVLEQIRAKSSIPVIALTARTDTETTVQILHLGADDYITKPFNNDELLARIDVQLRRISLGQPREEKQIKYKGIVLNLDRYDAFVGGKKAGLSKREFEVLRLMMSHPRKVFTKNNIYESIWGGEFWGDDNLINVYISKLRSKLNAIVPETEYIQTVWGIGFKMKE